MKVRVIDGIQLKNMLVNGLNVLSNEEDEINALNVFPVADGDTGTNMRLTLEHGLNATEDTPAIGAFLKQLTDGMLLSAHGNSGVILSQIFRGIFLELQHAGRVKTADLRNALIRGYKTAYNAVLRPVEGTMLTVSREGIENIRNQVTRLTTVDELFGMYLAEMNKSLQRTTELLPELKAARVVDSGAKGYIAIVKGMQKYLFGEIVDRANPVHTEEMPKDEVDETLFNENSDFKDGYCCEFVLQLLKGGTYSNRYKEDVFLEDLKTYGNSIVCVRNGSRVKVHAHAMKPGKILAIAQEYGEFVSLSIENMQIQHNAADLKKNREKAPIHKTLGIVGVANGDGFRELFTDLGMDICLGGGLTMNTSPSDFVDAFRGLDADRIVVFPNNKNIRMAAEQAKKLCMDLTIDVIPTESQLACYSALQMDIPDSADSDYRVRSMKQGADRIQGMFFTTATRDYVTEQATCKKGDCIAVFDGQVISAGPDVMSALSAALSERPDCKEAETVILVTGAEENEALTEQIVEYFEENCPMTDVTVLRGGQPVFQIELGFLA